MKQDEPLYMISVVARMLDVHPQTLRLYEREGFVNPSRINRQRLYSDRDVERLSMVLRLTRELGVNRAGVDIILRMRKRLDELTNELERALELLDNEDSTQAMSLLKNLLEPAGNGPAAGKDTEKEE